ncbi:glycosyl hydrolase family 1 domain-containing protein [Sarocladium implicatum]|nr:glycosyl hydrolase family 1 domain-containing protein [Sarocladium implicatum]
MPNLRSNWHPLPVFHLKAPHGWLNDPCGPAHDARTGLYHIFYQWNPKSCDWGDITWGQYISHDGLHWSTNSSEPVIKPDKPYDKEGVFTGCLYPTGPQGRTDELTVIYSSISYLPIHWSKPYARNCAGLAAAVSQDGGKTWEKIKENPILIGEPENLTVVGFRDPYLASWSALDAIRGSSKNGLYGVVSGGIKGDGPAVFLYRVEPSNLLQWEYLGPLIVAPPRTSLSGRWGGDTGVNWECANFMTLHDDQGHEGNFLTVGSEGAFDTEKSSTDEVVSYRGYCMWTAGSLQSEGDKVSMNIEYSGLLDHGCFYAPSSYQDPGSAKRIVWGWLKEEELTLERRESKGWTGSLSIPRELFLLRLSDVVGTLKSPLETIGSIKVLPGADGEGNAVQTLGIRPLAAMEGLRQEAPKVWQNISFGSKAGSLLLTSGAQWEIEAVIQVGSSRSPRIGFHLHHNKDLSQRATIFFDPFEEEIVFDLSASNTEQDIQKPTLRGAFTLFNQQVRKREEVALEKLCLRIFGDGDSVEVFANDRFALSAMAYGGLTVPSHGYHSAPTSPLQLQQTAGDGPAHDGNHDTPQSLQSHVGRLGDDLRAPNYESLGAVGSPDHRVPPTTPGNYSQTSIISSLGTSASPLPGTHWYTDDFHHPWLSDLAVGFAAQRVASSPFSYMGSCINIFFESVYPTYPVLYRPSIDASLASLKDPGHSLDSNTFTLITALCAYTLAVSPTCVSGETTATASLFYLASKKGLESYVEQDMEKPDYTSIVIRMFHSGYIHASGKAKLSWYVLGECIRITQVMKLHDERSYEGKSYLEAQLCRRVFWTLYTGDKSAAVLGSYPMCLRNDLFPDGITVAYPDHLSPQDDVEYTTPSGAVRQMSLMDGFNANQTLWKAAEPLIVAGLSADRDLPTLANAFVEFCTCLDEIPTILAFHNTLVVSVTDFVFADQVVASHTQVPQSLAVQRTNVQVSYLCLKMVMLRTMPELFRDGMSDRGLSGENATTSPGDESGQSAITPSYVMTMLQIAEDMLQLIHTSTLDLIRLNGEACAEKIRLVAAKVLELADYNPYNRLMGRTRKYLDVYPHILAMLDSKAMFSSEEGVSPAKEIPVPESQPVLELPLPRDFVIGSATAAYQIEGAASQDGKGPSIWDHFSHLEPSRTSGEHGDVACDHYNRVAEDVALMKSYGLEAYRFSISWARLIPLGGRGDPINEDGIAFYSDLIDQLLQHGISPVVTLYHWDLPLQLQERYGGMLNTAEFQADFLRYARLCFDRFGDRVKQWVTFNEPYIISVYGFHSGVLAPGRTVDPAREALRAGHSIILAHAAAVTAYADEFAPRQQGQISIVLNGDYYEPFDPSSKADIDAAQRRMEFYIAWFADPVYLGADYPGCMRKQMGSRLPEFSMEEREVLKKAASINGFYGMNHYTSQYARARDPALPIDKNDLTGNVDELAVDCNGIALGPLSGTSWLRVTERQFRKLLSWVYARYRLPIIITENGCPCPGENSMTIQEAVNDQFRVRYTGLYLDAISRAIYDDGVEVSGYYAWSLMDNFEWSAGYSIRFGITHVDFETLVRTPKSSALYLKDTMKRRRASRRLSLVVGASL